MLMLSPSTGLSCCFDPVSNTPSAMCRVRRTWCGVMWCYVVLKVVLKGELKVVWCGVVWCGVVWCGVVWCGVVWCGVVRNVWCPHGMDLVLHAWYRMVWKFAYIHTIAR